MKERVEFYGLKLNVTKDVLIPRGETEFLVERVIKYASTLPPQPSRLKILDVGTGSGAIAIALAKNLPEADVTAVDISDTALQVAKDNANSNNIKNIEFIKSDLFELVRGIFDIIVSNPPYVRTDDVALDEDVKQNEPRLAWDGGVDGLDVFRRFFDLSPKYLEDNGAIFLEIGYDQGESVATLAKKAFPGKEVVVEKDYSAHDRYVTIK